MNNQVQAKVEAVVGAGLMATPWWAQMLANVHLVFGAVAAVCGAIIGIHAVWRLWKRSKK